MAVQEEQGDEERVIDPRFVLPSKSEHMLTILSLSETDTENRFDARATTLVGETDRTLGAVFSTLNSTGVDINPLLSLVSSAVAQYH